LRRLTKPYGKDSFGLTTISIVCTGSSLLSWNASGDFWKRAPVPGPRGRIENRASGHTRTVGSTRRSRAHDAEEKNYEDFSVHSQLAELYAELGEDAKAIEYFEKTAKYARPHSRDIAAEALLASAILRERHGHLEDAYQAAAYELKPRQCKIRRRTAYACARLGVRTGRTAEALSALRRLFVIAPRTSLRVPGKPVFEPIEQKIRGLLNHLRVVGGASARGFRRHASAKRIPASTPAAKVGSSLRLSMLTRPRMSTGFNP